MTIASQLLRDKYDLFLSNQLIIFSVCLPYVMYVVCLSFCMYVCRYACTDFRKSNGILQVRLKWLLKNLVAQNLLPGWTVKCFSHVTLELIDRFSKFRRYMLRFESGDYLKFLSLKITSGLEGKILVAYNMRILERIF